MENHPQVKPTIFYGKSHPYVSVDALDVTESTLYQPDVDFVIENSEKSFLGTYRLLTPDYLAYINLRMNEALSRYKGTPREAGLAKALQFHERVKKLAESYGIKPSDSVDPNYRPPEKPDMDFSRLP